MELEPQDARSVSCKRDADFTDITDEDDFGVCRNMLGEEGLLVVGHCEFMLAGWIGLASGGRRQVEEVKPALCAHGHHVILWNMKKTHTHRMLRQSLQITCMVRCCRLHWPFPCCRRLQHPHKSAGTEKTKDWINKHILSNHERFLFFLVISLTMPTQLLVIQGLESSFLYTSSFPLVSPTTSSFNWRTQSTFKKKKTKNKNLLEKI